MPNNKSLPPQHLDFIELLRIHEMQKTKRRDELAKLVAIAPVSDAVLKEVVFLGPVEQEAVLKCHPGHVIETKLQSLWSMLSIFNKSHGDLLIQLDKFHAFSLSEDMFLPVGRVQREEINLAVEKELVAFSAAASSLVAYCRRLKDIFNIPELDKQTASSFDAQEHQFVTSLRNWIFHQEFPDVRWQVRHSDVRETDFIIAINDDLHQDGLTKEARTFAKLSANRIAVRALTESYATRVRKFYAWYRSAIDTQTPIDLVDYRRVTRACKANASRIMFCLLIKQFWQNKVDPFKHLHKYLLPSQLEIALDLPMRSKKQVDYIISAVDEHGACDDELRQMVYDLFDVIDQNNESP